MRDIARMVPAVIYVDGQKEWYLEGYRHREDGPAVIYSNGDEVWWEYGKILKK